MTIIPRWEWRTFGESFGPAEERFAALKPKRVEDSDETYLLSTRSDASVKIRGGVMDVKHLEAVNDDGLEQWLPILKGGFPLRAGTPPRCSTSSGSPRCRSTATHTRSTSSLTGSYLRTRSSPAIQEGFDPSRHTCVWPAYET